MFRDFSDEAKQKLLKYVDEVTADGTWDRVKDWFGDAGLTIQSWLGQLSIQNYVNDVDTYHKKVHHGKADRGDLFERAGSGYQIPQHRRK